MSNRILNLIEMMDTGVSKIQGFLCEDPSIISLDARWKVFLKAEHLLPEDSYYFDIPSRFTYYDNLYCDKHQSIMFSKIIERLSSAEVDPLTEAETIELKEQMLNSGFGSCVNDW